MASQTKARYRVLTLDDVAADSGKYRTQEEWSKWFNKHNRIMASAPDVYQAGKSGSNKLLRGLREDFELGVVTSTRIEYNPDDLHARITHYVGSRVKNPVQSRGIVVPVYLNESIERVLREEEGLLYLQTLFNTNDKAEEIVDILENLRKKEDNRIWTLDQEDRRDYMEGATFFLSGCGEFLIVGDALVGGLNGRSRGCQENLQRK